ncbi:MAG: 16S rRNA (cytidine(1402)-2'-O)-methyltransferase [Patescibacteria group bacterium]|jgi:16S rRNA (cytidine1402-2'-O)-methyltransferase
MLFIVATPIGNLEDITLRALRLLREVDLIACEDTRRTAILLQYYDIKKPLISFHQHSRLQKIDYLIDQLKSGQNIALVTDAGTPGIADPGGVLIAEALKHKIEVEAVPGPDAATLLLSQSGILTDKYLFLGFLPKKKGRQTLFKTIKNFEYPIVIFESPHRIKKTLMDIKENLGDRQVIVGRELTKKFEEILRGKVSSIQPKIKEQGEFVILIR